VQLDGFAEAYNCEAVILVKKRKEFFLVKETSLSFVLDFSSIVSLSLAPL